MIQSSENTYHFHLERTVYLSIAVRGWLLCWTFLSSAALALLAGQMLWPTYPHTFTFYLKWQDALEALLWFIAFITVGGSVFIVRFLYALSAGYRKGMLTLAGNKALIVRDLSPENLGSIFWMMHSAFWCFVAVLVGLLPEMLLGWTMHLPNIMLVVLATGVVLVLSLAGLVISVVAASFIFVGCIGVISFCRKLGAPYTYKLSNHTIVRIDNFVLTIIYPNTPEALIDLNLLAADEQRKVLALLQRGWVGEQRAWNPELGKEIKEALERMDSTMVLA